MRLSAAMFWNGVGAGKCSVVPSQPGHGAGAGAAGGGIQKLPISALHNVRLDIKCGQPLPCSRMVLAQA